MRAVLCDPSCGYCIANRKGQANYRGHRGYRVFRLPHPALLRESDDMLRRKSQSGSPQSSSFKDADASDLFPLVVEHVSATKFEDGKPRKTSTITLFVEGGKAKLCLSDREEGLTGWVSADTIWEAVRLLEQGLVDDSIDWRHAQWKKK